MKKILNLTFFTIAIALLDSCSKTRTSELKKETGTETLPVTLNLKVSTLAGSINPLYGKVIPEEVAIDAANNIYISDRLNAVIFKLSYNGELSILAGALGVPKEYSDGEGTNAKFRSPSGIKIGLDNNLYVSDYNGIRKITLSGKVTTYATKNGYEYTRLLTKDTDGNLYAFSNINTIIKVSKDGQITDEVNDLPVGFNFDDITIDSNKDFYLCSTEKHRIYKYHKGTGLSVYAGSGDLGIKDGVGVNALLSYPQKMVIGADGLLYFTDSHCIRKVSVDGKVSTIAGSNIKGFRDGYGVNALFNFPMGLAMDTKGNLYVADEDNKAIRKITSDGMVSTVYGSNNVAGQTTANVAKFNRPTGIALDASGGLYVADADNNVIRKIANGKVSLFAGTGVAGRADGLAKTATFNKPTGVNFDKDGNLYVADFGNNNLRKISPSGVVSSIELFVSNNGASGPENDPTSVAVDKNGGIFYTNSKWNTICKIANGLTSTFSNGITINNVDKFFFRPYSIAVDKEGNVYVADSGNHRIVKLDVNGRSTVIAGQLSSGNIPRSGSEDGKGRDASFNNPQGIAVDNKGNIYVADTDNNLIRKITTDGNVTTIAGSLTPGSNDDAPGKKAMFNKPAGLALNPAGTILYVADTGNDIIRKIDLY